MTSRFHGIVSICLVGVAVAIGAVTGFLTSWVWGIVYLVVSVLALGGILYAYCAKCPCQANCGHVIPGKLVAAFASRQPGPYTKVEMAVVVVALLALVGLPQVWLWRYPILLVAFWLLNAIAVVQIRVVVCRACDNLFCPMKAGA